MNFIRHLTDESACLGVASRARWGRQDNTHYALESRRSEGSSVYIIKPHILRFRNGTEHRCVQKRLKRDDPPFAHMREQGTMRYSIGTIIRSSYPLCDHHHFTSINRNARSHSFSSISTSLSLYGAASEPTRHGHI